MATILLTGQKDPSYVRAHQIRTSDRLRARLCAWQLDRALARGEPPDSTVALSLRAHRLIGPSIRHMLARRRVARERLDIELDEIDSGHSPMLACPTQLAARLVAHAIATPR
jgi:hypothetical protein